MKSTVAKLFDTRHCEMARRNTNPSPGQQKRCDSHHRAHHAHTTESQQETGLAYHVVSCTKTIQYALGRGVLSVKMLFASAAKFVRDKVCYPIGNATKMLNSSHICRGPGCESFAAPVCCCDPHALPNPLSERWWSCIVKVFHGTAIEGNSCLGSVMIHTKSSFCSGRPGAGLSTAGKSVLGWSTAATSLTQQKADAVMFLYQSKRTGGKTREYRCIVCALRVHHRPPAQRGTHIPPGP